MSKKELTNQQLAKMLKLRDGLDVFECSFNVYQYATNLKRYSDLQEAEANSLVAEMLGTDGRKGQGLQPEKKHFSGLSKLMNAKIKELGLTWKIKEQPNGEGLSMYTLL